MNLDRLYRTEYGRLLASLIRYCRDFDLAEDALHSAFEAALVQWRDNGPPDNPPGWLMTTARRRIMDRHRHNRMAETRHEEIAYLAGLDNDEPEVADSLRLIFTCCHPALAVPAQIALTLRTLCGLTTEEIARAFMVPVPTLAQRIVRAKAKIRDAGIPYQVPADRDLAERLDAVLAVIYLVFNEGYAARDGERLVRADLCEEAIRLGRLLVALMPDAREAHGLLALMLLHHSRRDVRTDDHGDLVLLEDQDRGRWDAAMIAEGTARVGAAMGDGAPGPYAIQAAIAALHAGSMRAEDTDWRRIAALYSLLMNALPTPVVALNRAVAVAMADGLERGLALLDDIHLPDYHHLPAARADLLRRLGRAEEAAVAYRDALDKVTHDAERRLLQRRLAEVTASPS